MMTLFIFKEMPVLMLGFNNFPGILFRATIGNIAAVVAQRGDDH